MCSITLDASDVKDVVTERIAAGREVFNAEMLAAFLLLTDELPHIKRTAQLYVELTGDINGSFDKAFADVLLTGIKLGQKYPTAALTKLEDADDLFEDHDDLFEDAAAELAA